MHVGSSPDPLIVTLNSERRPEPRERDWILPCYSNPASSKYLPRKYFILGRRFVFVLLMNVGDNDAIGWVEPRDIYSVPTQAGSWDRLYIFHVGEGDIVLSQDLLHHPRLKSPVLYIYIEYVNSRVFMILLNMALCICFILPSAPVFHQSSTNWLPPG